MKKKITFLKMMLLAVVMLAGSAKAWAQATVLSNDCSAATSGWTFTNSVTTQNIQQNGYWLLEATTTAKDVIISSNIDVSAYTDLSLKFQVATYGSGTNYPALVEYSTDGGTTWSATTYTSATPTSSTYVSNEWILGTINTTQLKFRFTHSGTGNKGVRLDNISLVETTTTPTINSTPASLTAFSAYVGQTATKTLTVSGVNLTSDILIELSGTDMGKFSVNPTSITQTGGVAPNTPVTVTYQPDVSGAHTATLTLKSTGVTDIVYTLNGTASYEPLATPIATTATNISQTGFTANWNAVTEATSYDLSVYTKTAQTTLATDLFISEYGEGSSNNKYLEIYNGTGAPVDLSNYALKQSYNGAGWPISTTAPEYLPLSGTLQPNDVFVVAASTANAAILAQADMSIAYSTTTQGGRVPFFTGDDALGLFKNNVLIDVFGDPSSNLTIPVAGFSTYGQDHTIVRKPAVNKGNTDWVTSSGTNTTDSEWIGYASDTWDHIGSHTMDGGSPTLVPVTGSPFTGITGTNYNVSGLSNANTYYYTLVAKDATRTSDVSNEITVNLVATGLFSTKTDALAWTSHGKVMLQAAAGETIEIFNVAGQKVVSRMADDGLNTVNVPVKGVVIVKVNNRISKVIL